MPIAALPPNTIRVIGSTQVITDPPNAVKELVDNALDACASAIFVEISVNTLDVIQVKDNGHGISPDDREMVCRRYCTSKIRDLHDLEVIGGRFLGFRGEALASAADMSGSVIVSTRIEGEPVAACIKVNRSRDTISRERTSHPVGTTVRVVDFLKHLPVRKESALKTSLKSLSRIKRMLQAYAIARPSIRFSLKVLKAKNEKGNWIYAPKPGATVVDAATKVFDHLVVGQCEWRVRSYDDMSNETSSSAGSSEGIVVEALFPRPHCDATIVSNLGQFVSVDSRPVSCTRGTFKQLISLYKAYARSSSTSPNSAKLSDPVLCMNIVCPVGSYDANIEPAKDDVLFADSTKLITAIESFLKDAYGELRTSTITGADQHSKYHNDKPSGFELLLNHKSHSQLVSRKTLNQHQSNVEAKGSIHTNSHSCEEPAYIIALSPQTANDCLQTQAPSGMHDLLESRPASMVQAVELGTVSMDDKAQKSWSRMYSKAEDSDNVYYSPFINARSTSDQELEDDVSLRNVSVSNPWTFAKMNVPIRRSQNNSKLTLSDPGNGQLLTPEKQRGEADNPTNFSETNLFHQQGSPPSALPTPREQQAASILVTPGLGSSSPGLFSFPMKAWSKSEARVVPRKPTTFVAENSGNGAIDDWLQKSVKVPRHDVELINEQVDPLQAPADGFVSARTLHAGIPLNDIPEAPQKRLRKTLSRKQRQQGESSSFLNPSINNCERVWSGVEPKHGTYNSQEERSRNARDTTVGDSAVRFEDEEEALIAYQNLVEPVSSTLNSVHPDLAITMDYEMRKQAAMQKRKESLRQQAIIDAAAERLDHNEGHTAENKNSPYKNRYNKALAALQSSSPTTCELPLCTLENHDPRAYLMRIQEQESIERSDTTGKNIYKSKRRKTTLLPFETIPVEQTIQDLVWTVNTPLEGVVECTTVLTASDDYVRSGINSDGIICTVDEAKVWEHVLRKLLSEKIEGGINFAFDLWTALDEHMCATD